MKWLAEVNSRTSRPACVWRVPLVTVPDNLTVVPGAAYDGFIALMVTERWPALACAGTADASPAARVPARIAAGTANTAVFRRIRLRFAVAKPCTPGMLVSGKRSASGQEPGCSRGTPAVATLNGRAHEQRTAESDRRAAARADTRSGRDRPPVRAPRLRTRAGRRSGPGCPARSATRRPRSHHERDPRSGADDGQRLGRPDLGGRDRVRHRRAAQGQRGLRDHHLPQRAVRTDLAQARRTVRYLAGGRPGAPRFHRQRDGGPAARVRLHRPVRRLRG